MKYWAKTRSSLQCFCCASSARPSSFQVCWVPPRHRLEQGRTLAGPLARLILLSWAARAKSLPIFPNIYIAAILLARLKLEMWSINIKLPVAPKSISRLWDCLRKKASANRGQHGRSLRKDVEEMGDLKPLEQEELSSSFWRARSSKEHLPWCVNSSSFFEELSSVLITKCYSRNGEKRELVICDRTT